MPLGVRGRSALVTAALASVLAASALFSLADDGIVLCMFRRVTTLPCPSCGMTRAFCALSHGDLGRALRLHLAAPFLYGATWVALALAVAETASGRALLAPLWRRTRRLVVPGVLALMAAAWTVNLAARVRELSGAPTPVAASEPR